MSYRKIELPVHMILVQFDPDDPGAAGSITCDPGLYEICPKCSQPNCLYQCDGSHLGEVQTEDMVAGRLQGNAAIDAILSFILAHACAGIDIESPAYLRSIETVFDAVSNNA